MHTKYGNQVQFIIVYTVEAHPVGAPSPYSGEEWTTPASMDQEGRPLNQPSTYEERLVQADQMKNELNITVPILIDEVDNAVWCTYGPAPNNAHFIGTDGVIVEKQGWYRPEQMEEAIEQYLAER